MISLIFFLFLLIDNNIPLIYYFPDNNHHYKQYKDSKNYLKTTHYLYNKNNEKEWILERLSLFKRPLVAKEKLRAKKY